MSLYYPVCPDLLAGELSMFQLDGRNPEQLMTEQEVATLLKRAVKTLRNDRSAGRGPKWCKLGGMVRYRLADVMEWVHDKTGGGSTAIALVAGLLGYG